MLRELYATDVGATRSGDGPRSDLERSPPCVKASVHEASGGSRWQSKSIHAVVPKFEESTLYTSGVL